MRPGALGKSSVGQVDLGEAQEEQDSTGWYPFPPWGRAEVGLEETRRGGERAPRRRGAASDSFGKGHHDAPSLQVFDPIWLESGRSAVSFCVWNLGGSFQTPTPLAAHREVEVGSAQRACGSAGRVRRPGTAFLQASSSRPGALLASQGAARGPAKGRVVLCCALPPGSGHPPEQPRLSSKASF